MIAIHRAPRATVSPPPYTRTPPPYSSTVSSAASSLFSSDISESNTYEYGSKAVSLSFSQYKRRGVRLPAFGRGGIVDGEIALQSNGHIDSVTVSFRGEIKTVIESSYRPTSESTTLLIDETHTLWSRHGQSDLPTPHLIPFSFSFPNNIKGQQTPLPPSFTGALVEGTVQVRYTISACVRRVGWRSNTTVKTEVFYLPRPVEVAYSPVSSSLNVSDAPNESPDDTKIVEIPVKQSIAGKQQGAEVKAHLACPVSISLSRNQVVPFTIHLQSPVQYAERLLEITPHVSVRLVRIASITARGMTITDQSTCSHGIIHKATTPEGAGTQLVTISGVLPLNDTISTSWAVPKLTNITYAIQVTLPPSAQPNFAYFNHSEPVPTVSGSSGSPDSPDLSIVPNITVLLRKTTGYMPMRV